ncbi:SRPBCC family protein [Aliivibrio sifiae]|uniref:Ubiquinone-binding protein n=1 Tax=Aliivibrio sifiae TaxID=566293 RepID=A0A2S7XG66_9GAMM|nr:SRPBCC family protein [Aliivibrio sifiae]PQJ92707.1 ubiquinone-binding protein [Aliivibrio sifiae]GLR74784.1 ubiquinone-binding protein [Aliivibrio sifiae]
MPQVSRSALVPFSAKQMYDLVNDVASYPQFLPGCSGSQIIEQTKGSMIASVDVAKAGIKKTFTTKNTLVDSEVIGMNLVDGPFKSLTGGWHFIALDETACKVELKLEFEFSNALVAMAFGKVFQELTNNMVNSFTQRAKQVYVSN